MNKHPFRSFLADALISALIAGALARVMNIALHYYIHPALPYLMAAGFVLVFSLFTINLKTTLALVVVFGGAALYVAVYYTEVFSDAATWLLDQTVWIFGYAFGRQGYRYGPAELFAVIFIAGFFALCALILVRGIKRTWPAVLFCSIIVVVEWFKTLDGNIALCLLALVPAIFALLARNMYYRSKRVMEEGHQSGITVGTGARSRLLDKASPHALSITALITAAAVAAGTWFLFPAEKTSWRWPGLVHIVDDVNDVISESRGWPNSDKPHNGFSLKWVGFGDSSGGSLGGDVLLPDGRAFEITGTKGEHIFLTGSIYNYYNGKSWEKRETNARYRLGSAIWQGRQNEIFDSSIPVVPGEGDPFVQQFSQHRSFKITMRMGGTSTLFYPSNLKTLSAGSSQIEITPYYSELGNVFNLQNVKNGAEYIVQADIAEKGTGWTRLVSQLINEYKRDNPELTEYEKKIYEQYTQLPEDMPASVKELADLVVFGTDSDFRKVRMLESYFKTSGFKYTLTPGTPDETQDFVAQFLKKRQGYCSYFATAMAVMCRAEGIPARYVEGFVTPDDKGDICYVRQKNAHAWVEVYFRGIGWLTFDPTPGNYLDHTESGDEPEPTPVPSGSYDEFEEPTVPPTESFSGDDDGGEDSGMTEEQKEAVNVFVVAIAGFVALLLAVLIWLRARVNIRYTLHYVQKKFKDDRREQLFYYYRDMLDLLRLFGYPVQPGETPFKYAERIGSWADNEEGTFMEMTEMMVAAKFGGYEPKASEIERFYWFHKLLRRAYKRASGIFRFWQTEVFGRSNSKAISTRKLEKLSRKAEERKV